MTQVIAFVSESDASAMHAVLSEMNRQDGKWGVQEHDFSTWNEILGEEVGEVDKAILGTKFPHGEDFDALVNHYREECAHVAAVAIRMIANLDRQHTK